MLAYRPSTPLFDERFVNYGYNKVQLFEHLRVTNHRFYVINNAFSVDILHPQYSLFMCTNVDQSIERSTFDLVEHNHLLCNILIRNINVSLIVVIHFLLHEQSFVL